MNTISQQIAAGRDKTVVMLRPTYPCHGRRVRLEAVASIPRQRYERACPDCGFVWAIERTTVREANGACRIDRLDWTMADD